PPPPTSTLFPYTTLFRSDDPRPARSHRDQERHGQRERPAGDEQPPPSETLGGGAGREIGQRLGEAEGDDERQHRGARRDPELVRSEEHTSELQSQSNLVC